MARLQFALGKADFKDDYQKNKTEFSRKINEIRLEIDSDVKKAEQKLNTLKEEVKSVFNGFLIGMKNN